MRQVVLFIFLCFTFLTVYSQIDFDKHFTNNTLRIDFHRKSGEDNRQFENLVFIKETFWSGNPNNTIEPFDFGEYRIDVRDSISNELIYNFSYSTLFYEFQFTEESQIRTKIFEETVRLPFPKKTIKISFYSRNINNNLWFNELEIYFNPHFSKTENIAFDKSNLLSKQIQNNGSPQNKLDFVILSEAYTLNQSEKFFADAEKISSYLLKTHPFNNNSSKINIWAVFYPSQDSLISNSEINSNTALGLRFNTFNTERYLMTDNIFKVRNLASVVPYDHIIILANTSIYGGGGIYNFYATLPSDNLHSDFLLIHELGHSFAGLADEYYNSEFGVSNFYPLNVEPWEPNITTLVNFQNKWKDKISENTPIPTPLTNEFRKKIGVFEGAGYSKYGIYRPFYNCTMKSAVFNYFCPICVQHIEYMINYYSLEN